MKLRMGLAMVLASGALASAAVAQSSGPISGAEVVGDWALVVTPVDSPDRRVTFKAKDGSSRLDFPLTITAQTNGRLACVVDGATGDCRIREGRLVVVSSGGGVRMIYTLTDRARGGFSGGASMRVRLLPIGGDIGSVVMTRR